MARPSTPISQPQGYWDGVATASVAESPTLWREQSDVVNGLLLDRWLPADGALRMLKTDLYDELVAPGLYPKLRPRASRVVGIDISPAAVDAVSARYPRLESVVADVRDRSRTAASMRWCRTPPSTTSRAATRWAARLPSSAAC